MLRLCALAAVAMLLLAACGPAAEASPTPTRPPTPLTGATPPPTTTPTPAGPGATPAATPKPTPTAAPAVPGTPQPRYGGVLKFSTPADPDRFDRLRNITGDTAVRDAWDLVFSKFIEFEWPKKGDASCSRPLFAHAAESWQWKGNTLEIKLRPGIKFHPKAPVNGRELTAEDAAWSLNRAKAEQARFSEYLDSVSEIKAVDRYTLNMVSQAPTLALLYGVLASYYGSTPTAKESAGKDGGWDDPDRSWIGTGPFMFKAWRPGVKITLERNPSYFKPGLPYLSGVEMLVLPDGATRMALLRSGVLELDTYKKSAVTVQAIQATNPDIRVSKCPATDGIGTIQIRNDLPPWTDVRVRRALFLAIDQDAIIKSVLQGEGFPSGAILHTMILGLTSREDYPPEVRKYLYANPTEAKKLLAEAGFPNGFDTTLEFTRYYGSPWNEAAEAVQSMLNNAGIRAKLVWLERGRYNAQRGNQDALLISSASAPEPWHRLVSYPCDQEPGINRSRVCDREVTDKLLKEFNLATDETRVKEIIRLLMVRWVDQAYFYSLPAPFYYLVGQPRLRNFDNGDGQGQYITPLFEQLWMAQ